MIKRFIEQIKSEEPIDTSYDAGYVSEHAGDYIVTREMYGAWVTFSVGQPVYDEDLHLMGYLGIGLYPGLGYACEVPTPCEYWSILNRTKYCKAGKKVLTYWQYKERFLAEQGAKE